MRLQDSGPLTDEQRDQLERGEEHPFGTDGAELQWRRKDRHVLLYDDDGRLVASTGLLLAQAEVGRGEGNDVVDVVGIGGVFVTREHRGGGHARTVVEAALERAATLGPDFALLFSRPGVEGLYARLGFTAIADPVVVEQPPHGTARLAQVTMWRALRAGRQWPRGPVRLLGPPF